MPSEAGVSHISNSEVEAVAKISETAKFTSRNLGTVSISNELVEGAFQSPDSAAEWACETMAVAVAAMVDEATPATVCGLIYTFSIVTS